MSPSPSSASSSGGVSNTPAPHDGTAANPGLHIPVERSAQAAEEEKEDPLNDFANVGESHSCDYPKSQPFRTPQAPTGRSFTVHTLVCSASTSRACLRLLCQSNSFVVAQQRRGW